MRNKSLSSCYRNQYLHFLKIEPNFAEARVHQEFMRALYDCEARFFLQYCQHMKFNFTINTVEILSLCRLESLAPCPFLFLFRDLPSQCDH